MNVFTTEKCISDTDWPRKYISSKMICAGYLGSGKGTCSGKAMKPSKLHNLSEKKSESGTFPS